MSKVSIEGNASGTGTLTIAAPNTNSNYTLTLPTESGTIITGSGGVTGVAQGGTGASTLTANNVILGNGTSAVQFVAPGTSGNVLTSNGTTWASTAPAGGSANIQTFDTSGTWTKPASGSMARVQMWGGGGGGARAAAANTATGGGGGGYNEFTVPLSYLDSSVSVTVAAGGAGRTGSTGVGTVGGTTSVPVANYIGESRTFYAYGGQGGPTAVGFSGGGGILSAGANEQVGRPWIMPAEFIGDAPGWSVEKLWAGGMGSNGGTANDRRFDTVFAGNGGAGAGGTSNSTGGTSIYGGKGGDGGRVTSGFDGTAPAGGGGGRNNNLNGGNGAAGRVIVTVW